MALAAGAVAGLGGPASGSPARPQAPSYSSTGPQVQLAVLGTDQGLWTRRTFGSNRGYVNLGGTLLSTPAVYATADGDSEYLGEGTNHLLYVRTDSRGWQRVADTNLSCHDPAATAVRLHDRTGAMVTTTMWLACRNDRGNVLLANWQGTASQSLPRWTSNPFENVGGVIYGAPAILSVPGGEQHIRLYVRGGMHPTGNIWTKGSYEQDWRPVAVTCADSPSVSDGGSVNDEPTSQFWLTCEAPDGQLAYARSSDGVTFGPVREMGGQVRGPVAAALSPDAQLDEVFAAGTNRDLYQTFLSDSFGRATWADLGGQLLNGVKAGVFAS